MDETAWQNRVVVRLFRLWATAREDGETTLRRMYEVANELRLSDQTTPACDSLFTLVEGTLGRRLVRGTSCAPRLSTDEAALLGVIEAAPSLGTMRGSAVVPHGLPGAILWAAMCVRDAVGWSAREARPIAASPISGRTCPFASGAEVRLAS